MIGLDWTSMAWMLTVAPAFAQGSGGVDPQAWLLGALGWIEGLGVVGGLAFIVIYIVATVAFLPGSMLTLGAGVIFGVVMGSVYVFVGATLGAIAAFLVGRYLTRDWVSRKLEGKPSFSAIDRAVAEEGFKIVLLTRLSPVFPFNLLNYAFGLTGVSLQNYALASVGMIPGTILYVYLGSLAGDLARLGTEDTAAAPATQWAIRLMGFGATVAVTVYVTRLARQALAAKVG